MSEAEVTAAAAAEEIRARTLKNAKAGISTYSNGDVSISKIPGMEAEDLADRIERRQQRRLRGFKSVIDMGGPK